MTKDLIKELIIVLLLCLAIILVLGILLYEYVPVSKTIPNEVSYSTPEEVKEELLASDAIDESEIIMTYEVNSDDLRSYKSTQSYKPGKANPFSSYDLSQTNGENTTNGSSTGGTTGNTSSGDQGSNSTNTSENTTTSGGSFLQDKGTK